MKAVFADTSFYLAVLGPHDLAHTQALQVVQRLRRPLLLTDFILLELGNTLSAASRRGLFSGLVRHLRAKPNVRIIPASHDLLDRGLDLFSHRADKEWSLTDCTSFVVMREEGLTDALTTNHHFEQVGFNVMLR
jgi:predicted nucleic acid-binding protein